MVQISYFNTGITSDLSSPLEKKACLFYEAGDGGIHKDSKGREHKVDESYLRQLEKNTNSALSQGETIYLINNHVKDDFDATYGYLDSNVYVKEIDEQDAIENPKLKSLIGRLALFADKIKITSKKLKEKIKEGIKFPNISVGLDMDAMRLKEISMTAMPALANASLFNEGTNTEFAGVPGVTMQEVMSNKYKKESNHDEAEELLDTFLCVVDNLKYTRDEDLTGGTREAFYQQAIEDFVDKLTQVTDIGPDPGYASQTAVQDQINREHTYINENGRPQIIGYNQMNTYDFTMTDVENAKFTMEGTEAEFITLNIGGKKKKKGLLRRGLEIAGVAAGLRYGKGIAKGAIKSAQVAGRKGAGVLGKTKAIAKGGFGGAKRGIMRDVSGIKKTFKGSTPKTDVKTAQIEKNMRKLAATPDSALKPAKPKIDRSKKGFEKRLRGLKETPKRK